MNSSLAVFYRVRSGWPAKVTVCWWKFKEKRYGLHRQDAAMMTCFTPSALRSDHVHFIDGARGGYASAATALKISPDFLKLVMADIDGK